MNLTTISHAYNKATCRIERLEKLKSALTKKVVKLSAHLSDALFFIRNETICECSDTRTKCAHCEILAKLCK